jgi:hypothetical protein
MEKHDIEPTQQARSLPRLSIPVAPTSQSPVHHPSTSACVSARLTRKADSWRHGRGKSLVMHGKTHDDAVVVLW